MTERDYSSSNSEDEKYSDEEEINDIQTLLEDLKPYQFEPEAESLEEASEEDSEEDSNEEEENMSENRAGKEGWCQCKKCHIEEREIDCLCCKELPELQDETYDGKFLAQTFSL